MAKAETEKLVYRFVYGIYLRDEEPIIPKLLAIADKEGAVHVTHNDADTHLLITAGEHSWNVPIHLAGPIMRTLIPHLSMICGKASDSTEVNPYGFSGTFTLWDSDYQVECNNNTMPYFIRIQRT